MYKIWRNKVTAIIKNSKKDYFNKAIQSKTDSENIWRNLQQISSNEKNPYEVPYNLIVDDLNEEGTVNVINRIQINIGRFQFYLQFQKYLRDILQINLKSF